MLDYAYQEFCEFESAQDRRKMEMIEPKTKQDVLDLYGTTISDNLVSSIDIEKHVYELREVRSQIDKLKRVEERLIDKIAVYMKNHETLITDDGETLVTWKPSKPRESFNSALFKAENKALYKKYTQMKPGSRTFLVKD